jgi:hypothetical protein
MLVLVLLNCRCGSQRGEDEDQPHDATVFYSSENSGCLSSQVTTSDSVAWNSGTFVWTVGLVGCSFTSHHFSSYRCSCTTI